MEVNAYILTIIIGAAIFDVKAIRTLKVRQRAQDTQALFNNMVFSRS